MVNKFILLTGRGSRWVKDAQLEQLCALHRRKQREMRLWIQSCATSSYKKYSSASLHRPSSPSGGSASSAPPKPSSLSLHRLWLRHLLRSHPFVRRLLLSQPPLLNRPCLSLLFTFSLHFMFSPLFSLSLSLSAGSSISTLLNTCTSFAPQQNSIPAKSVSMKLNWN